MTKVQIRVLILIAIALVVWRVLEVPAINEAVWEFLTIGLVPGTDVILSAETVIRLALAVFVIAFFLIFRQEFMASLPPQWFRRNRQHEKPARITSSPSVVTVLPRQSMDWDRSALLRPIGFLAGWLVYIVSVICAAAEKTLRAAGVLGMIVGRKLWRMTKAATFWVVALSVRCWYFIEPSLRAFDQWLNVMVHKSKVASNILDTLDAAWKELRARWRKADFRARKVLSDRQPKNT